MNSISSAAREIIRNRPFLEDALSRNIINYNSLAEEIQGEVKRILKVKEIKLTSLAMALRRIGEKYRKVYDRNISIKLNDFIGSDTTIKYDLFEISIQLSKFDKINTILAKIYKSMDADNFDFFSVTKGRSELTIISSKKFKNEIKSILNKYKIINETYDLAALSIKIPDDSLVTPGLFYYFTKALTLEGINIAELVSTFSEIQFILDEIDVNDASRVIRKLIKNTDLYT